MELPVHMSSVRSWKSRLPLDKKIGTDVIFPIMIILNPTLLQMRSIIKSPLSFKNVRGYGKPYLANVKIVLM